MKTTELKTFLQRAKKINKGKNTLEILDNVLLNKKRLTVTDLQTTFVKSFAEAPENTVLIPLLFLDKIVAKIKTGSIDLSQNGIIKTEKGDFKYNLSNEDQQIEFIDLLPTPEYFNFGSIEAETIRDIKEASFYVTKDDLRPVMSGVYIGKDKICGTDAHKLYFKNLIGKVDHEFIIPSGTISILEDKKTIVQASFEDHENAKLNFKLICEDEEIFFRAIDGKYPNFEALIPKENNKTMQLSKKELLEKLDLAMLAANKYTKKIVFDSTALFIENEKEKDVVYLSASDEDHNTEYNAELKNYRTGDPITIGFNASYLKEALKFTGEEVIISMSESNRPAILNDFILIMPLMLH